MTGNVSPRPLRAWVGGVIHETNSFSPIPTSFDDFVPFGGAASGLAELADAQPRWPGYAEFIGLCREHGVEVTPGSFHGAQPSAPVDARTWTRLRQRVLDDLADSGPHDIVLLLLHGAQIAAGCDDCEGDLLAAARAQLGVEVAIGVLLDLHANLSPAMLAHSNVLMACKHYPHTDFPERAAEAFSILCRAASSEIAPVMAAVRVPAFGLYPTTEPPFDALVDDLQSAERQPGVLSASALHGFTGGDCPWLAAAIVVVADGDQARAQWVAMGLANGFLRRIETAPPIGLPIDDALTAAAAVSAGAPVVMSDGADNAGGGAAADSTVVLQALLDSALPLRPAAVALMWDPVTVELAHRAGLGARLAMRIGGKTGPMSGVPLDLDVEVTALAQDAMQTTFSSVPDQPLGRSVALRVGTWPASVDIVVNTERQQVFSPHVFTAHGLDPMAYRLLVVKSTQHFYAAFAPFAAAVVRCEAPGTMSEDARQLPYRHRPQPMRPWDPDAVCTPFWP